MVKQYLVIIPSPPETLLDTVSQLLAEMTSCIHQSYRYFSYITSPITLNFSSSTQHFSSLSKFPNWKQRNCPQIIFHIPPPQGHGVSILPAKYLSIPCPPLYVQCLLFDPYFFCPEELATWSCPVSSHQHSSSQLPQVSS